MPHQNKHTTRPINEATQFWIAMLDLLPVSTWLELHAAVQKTHIWDYKLEECTDFTVAE